MSWTLRAAGPEDAEAIAETLQIGFDGYREFAPPGWRPPDARSGAPRSPACAARLGEPSDVGDARRGRRPRRRPRRLPPAAGLRRAARTCGSCSCARRGGAAASPARCSTSALAAAAARGLRPDAPLHAARPGARPRLLRARGLRRTRAGRRSRRRSASYWSSTRASRSSGANLRRVRGRTARSVVAAVLALLCCAPGGLGRLERRRQGRRARRQRRTARLLMYRGNGAGALPVALPADRLGLGLVHRAARHRAGAATAGPTCSRASPTAALLMYRGNARGGFVTGTGESIGSGWGGFTALLAPGDFSGDGKPDILAAPVRRRRCCSTAATATAASAAAAVKIGCGWRASPRCSRPGDWNGDGKADVLARASDGKLLLYRGNGAGGWVTGRGRADRLRLAGLHGADRPAATSAATATPTSSPASPTARSCSTGATAPAASSRPTRRSASGWQSLSSSRSWASPAGRRRRRPRRCRSATAA